MSLPFDESLHFLRNEKGGTDALLSADGKGTRKRDPERSEALRVWCCSAIQRDRVTTMKPHRNGILKYRWDTSSPCFSCLCWLSAPRRQGAMVAVCESRCGSTTIAVELVSSPNR